MFKLSSDIPNQRPTQRVPAFAPPFQARNHLGISFHPAFQFRCRVGIHCERDIMMLAKSVQTRAVFVFQDRRTLPRYIYLHFPEDQPDVGKYIMTMDPMGP